MANECIPRRSCRAMSCSGSNAVPAPSSSGSGDLHKHVGFKRQELWQGLQQRLGGTPFFGGPLGPQEELDDADIGVKGNNATNSSSDEDEDDVAEDQRYLEHGPRATERIRAKSMDSVGARETLGRRGPSVTASTSVEAASLLSAAQKAGCFNYIKRRHSIALAFASDMPHEDTREPSNIAMPEEVAAAGNGSNWEFAKVKNGVQLFRSKRSRCEVRGVTQVNASVKNVMAILAAGDSSEAFADAQKILLGHEQVLEARVLASCAQATSSRYFHCGLKYQAMKNPFGVTPLDLVYLDYTDVSTTPDEKLLGFRILESIRVPELRPAPKYVRASIRCEVYTVRETDVPGVVEVTFASHLDPKSKCSSSKRSHWLDQAATRLGNLRAHAEKASFGHHVLESKGATRRRRAVTSGDKEKLRRNCSVCQHSFSFLRKRHNCRLCGETSCGRCCRKLPMLVDSETARVKVCLGCILRSRNNPDELGRTEIDQPARRGELANSTFIIYDE
ncbi:hypothetical protein BBJ28_00001722 [Nothophytophthora sp. Chile5]|nr:hypothetical protein BBJ28_00001722 [Nothophytophthora sp. Chile5]